MPALSLSNWFTQEVHAHDSSLKAFLRGRFPSVGDVDDVVQESYLRIWKARARQPIGCARAFLFRVAQNVALNLIRKRHNAPFAPLRDFEATRVIDDKADARDAIIIQERIDLLADALMSLPPRCREITLRHKILGVSQRELAEQLNLSERTIETQVRIGVARCAAYLEKHGVKPIHGDEA